MYLLLFTSLLFSLFWVMSYLSGNSHCLLGCSHECALPNSISITWLSWNRGLGFTMTCKYCPLSFLVGAFQSSLMDLAVVAGYICNISLDKDSKNSPAFRLWSGVDKVPTWWRQSIGAIKMQLPCWMGMYINRKFIECILKSTGKGWWWVFWNSILG